MKIGGLIIGKGVSDTIRDGRTLRAMSKAGHFKYPVDEAKQPYVDEEDRPRRFTYKNKEYEITYFSGCFYPFVVKYFKPETVQCQACFSWYICHPDNPSDLCECPKCKKNK